MHIVTQAAAPKMDICPQNCGWLRACHITFIVVFLCMHWQFLLIMSPFFSVFCSWSTVSVSVWRDPFSVIFLGFPSVLFFSPTFLNEAVSLVLTLPYLQCRVGGLMLSDKAAVVDQIVHRWSASRLAQSLSIVSVFSNELPVITRPIHFLWLFITV